MYNVFVYLQQLQLEIDDLQLEVKRKDTDLALMNTEKEKLMERLRDEEGRTHGPVLM